MSATIWHNPNCSTSRKALDALRAAGRDPEVIDYRARGWDRAGLERLIAEAGLSARQALRVRGTRAEELGLTGPEVSAEAILDAMVADPLLVERPFVRTEKGVRLTRPIERIEEIL